MTVSGVNNLISLQESQLIHMLQQQSAKARADANAQQRQAQAASDGQNLPGADSQTGTNSQADAVTAAPVSAELLDPALSPEKINALLLQLQTQQASLDTTLMLGGDELAGAGGKTLLNYLTAADNDKNAANDDAALTGALNMVDTLS